MAVTLKAARVNANLLQQQAAEALCISVDTLSKWENGKTFPNVLQIKKIEEIYGVKFGDLIFCPEDSVKLKFEGE